MKIYLLLIIAFLNLITSKKYNCVFDQLYKDYHPHLRKFKNKDQLMTHNHHGRQLLAGRFPMRITLNTSDFQTIKLPQGGANTTTNAHLQYIKRAMQVTAAFYQNRLQVAPLARIFAPTDCLEVIPSDEDQNDGITFSDLHIYVIYITDKSVGYGATGVSCKVFSDINVARSNFQEGRPTVGRIKFNTYTLLQNKGLSSDTTLLTNRRFAAVTATAIHETTHILGFDQNLYSTYMDPRLTDGSNYNYNAIISTATKLHLSRPATTLIRTPFVTQWAKNFFGCPTITGMQLQNQDGGLVGSHWERIIMYDQIMTGTQLGAQKAISGATLALLKDMGWYDVDDRFSDTTNYGYQKGCSFFTDACYSSTSLPKYFCNINTQANISLCSSTFLGKSSCSNIPGIMADGCGMWIDYANCVDPDQIDKFNIKSNTLQQYKTTSFCVQSTLSINSLSFGINSRCYPYACTYAPDVESIKFTVGSNFVSCLKSQGGIKKTLGSMTGYLECPVYDDFCVNSRKICKNWCNKNGICTRGICNCYPGFSGQDCSISVCTGTQFLNPADNTCGASCPAGTYQNKFARTCFPCASTCNECIGQPQICSSCHSTISSPKVYYNGLCYSACPPATYQVSDSCFDCDGVTAHCATCTGTATTCTSCTTSYLLDNPVSGPCGTTCTNPNYQLQDQINWKCLDNCTDNLVGAVLGAINICTLCPVNQFKWMSDRACHSDCALGFYKNTVKQLCKQCDNSCLYCFDSYAQNCTKCKNDNPNKYLLLNACVSRCPIGYYANDTSGQCQLCTVTLNCAACYVGGDGNLYCSTCKYGFYIQTNHTCIESCDTYMYKNQWNHSCDSCSLNCGDCSSPYDSSCINCRPNTYFLSNQTGGYCLADCPSVYYVKSGFNCLACHKTCKTCNGITSSSCHSCVDGLYLYSGHCRYVCPQKTYPNKQTFQCDVCDSKCKFCFGSTVDNCTSCETNLVLNNYTCSNSCPTGMSVNKWNVCQKFAQYLKISILTILVSFILITN